MLATSPKRSSHSRFLNSKDDLYCCPDVYNIWLILYFVNLTGAASADQLPLHHPRRGLDCRLGWTRLPWLPWWLFLERLYHQKGLGISATILRILFSFKFLNHLNPEHPAANALMISLVGIAVKITGAEIPGLNLEVKINMMQLVITVEQVPDGTGRSRIEDLQHLGLIQVQLLQLSTGRSSSTCRWSLGSWSRPASPLGARGEATPTCSLRWPLLSTR